MCNWFQNKSPAHTFAVDWETWHCNWAVPSYFNGASPTGSPRWGHCLQRHLACEGLYNLLLRIATIWHQEELCKRRSPLLSGFMITAGYCYVYFENIAWCICCWTCIYFCAFTRLCSAKWQICRYTKTCKKWPLNVWSLKTGGLSRKWEWIWFCKRKRKCKGNDMIYLDRMTHKCTSDLGRSWFRYSETCL